MGIEDNYRTSTNKQEIIETLIQIQIEALPMLIWQNEDGERYTANVKIEKIDYSNESIFLTPFTPEDEVLFNKLKINSTIYLKGNSKSIVFKQEKSAVKAKKGFLQIFIPNQVKMFEKRTEIRYDLTQFDPIITAELYPGGRKDISTRSIIVNMKDVSLGGMGFYLAKRHARLFSEKDKIKILRIGKNNFPRPITAEIVNIISPQDGIEFVRLGIRFTEGITKELIAAI